MRCLGLDIGSSSIKGAVLDLGANRVSGTVSRPFPAPAAGLPAGWFEVAIGEIEIAAWGVLRELMDAASEASSLYISGQMGGAVLIGGLGQAISPYYSWRDQRSLLAHPAGGTYLDEIRRRWGAAVVESLGNELQPGSATSLAFWLSENERLPPRPMLSTIADYVIGQMCESSPRMHVTQAIGLLDLRSSQLHREALDRLGLDELLCPALFSSVGDGNEFTIDGRSLRVYGAFGDQQCALRGAGLQHGELSLNVSTGSQVSRRSATFQPGRYQSRRYFDGDFLDTVTHLPAGRSLNVLVDLLTELAAAEGVALKNVWGNIARKTGEIDSTTLAADLAFFAGPLGSTGSIRGVTTENLTVGDLFHAAFRAMADNYAQCAGWLDPRREWSSVVLSGGLTESMPVLRRRIEERFAAPIRESVGDGTMLGLLDIAREVESGIGTTAQR